jgi:cysteine desulfurase / selenocysteine lyase
MLIDANTQFSVVNRMLKGVELDRHCAECLKTFDPTEIRKDFPILATTVRGKYPLAYLDNAASTQKPRAVLDRIQKYYTTENANVHRGVYQLSQVATHEYELAREKVRQFINAESTRQIIFTRGTTDAINLVAASFGRKFVKNGDEIIISAMEHHSNIVPWQLMCEWTGATLKVVPFNERGELDMAAFQKMLSPRTRLVAITHLSNVLGTINPVEKITALAHEHGARVLVDAAQWVGHFPTDVQKINCDFFAFSGHKMFGPTGIGVLYGKEDILEAMPPYQGGGDMIETVAFEKSTWNDLPYKFEAGTPNIADAIGLGAAVDYLQKIKFGDLLYYEHGLLRYAEAALQAIPGVRLIGTAENKSTVVSFVMEDPPLSSMDIGAHLDRYGIGVRTGHHCCMPLMQRMNVSSTVRASFAFYNTTEEVDRLANALRELQSAASKAAATSPAASPTPGTKPQLTWPEPFADSANAAADDLVETFEMLGDWEARDQFVVELGEKLLPLPESLKQEPCRVQGCMSTVHMVGRKRPGTADSLDILADSDAHLVRGLIGLLQHIYSGQKADDILALDAKDFLHRIGLDSHLSMGRRSGLEGMIKRIRTMARSLKETGTISPEFAA